MLKRCRSLWEIAISNVFTCMPTCKGDQAFVCTLGSKKMEQNALFHVHIDAFNFSLGVFRHNETRKTMDLLFVPLIYT